MIWTMDQVRKVKGLYTRVRIDLWHNNLEQAAEFACDESFRQLARMAHTHAVELHPGDCEVDRTEDRFRHTVITMRWRPSTKVVRLLGGPGDGEHLALQKAGEALRVAVQPPTPWVGEESHHEGVPTPIAVTYEPAGWDETERLWVYSPA